MLQPYTYSSCLDERQLECNKASARGGMQLYNKHKKELEEDMTGIMKLAKRKVGRMKSKNKEEK